MTAIVTTLDDEHSPQVTLSSVDCMTHTQPSVDLLSQTLPLHTSAAKCGAVMGSTPAVDVPSYEWRCANEGLARVWLGKVWYSSRDNDTPASIGEQLNVDPKLLVAENKGRLRGLKLGRRLYPYTPLVVPTQYTPIDDGALVETRPGFTNTAKAPSFKSSSGDAPTPTDHCNTLSTPTHDTALVACRSRYGRIHDPTQCFDPSLVALLPQWATKSTKQARKSSDTPSRDSAPTLADTKPVARKRVKLEVDYHRRSRDPEPIASSELPALGDELSVYKFEYVDARQIVPRLEPKCSEDLDHITSPGAHVVNAPNDAFSYPNDSFDEQRRRELHRRFGLDFSAMARDISTDQACIRRLVGELQQYYYSWPIAAREEEVLEAKNLKKRLLSPAHYRVGRDYHAEWHFEDEWLVKVEHKRRYYSKVRVTYRGRTWNLTPGPLSDAAQDALLLVPMVHAPDVPKSAFPVFVVDVYLDENKDAILAFRWFYRKHEFAGKAKKRASTFHDREVAVGSTVFTTPVDFVRDVALVGSSPEDLSVATFFCRREYDDLKNVLRPLLVLRPNTSL